MEAELRLEAAAESGIDESARPVSASMSLGEFVERKFIPEYVAIKRSAGRAHFQAILKHVLAPDVISRLLGGRTTVSRSKLGVVPDWPYIDSMQLSEVRVDSIQRLISAALERGYSTQTAVHIRNVLRAVFSHALKTGDFSGDNPAALVMPLIIARRPAHALTLDQWQRVAQLMHYPEREIALFAVLTGMNVAEICGLKWKYVNLSLFRQMLNGDWISPKTIVVRNQSYRGEVTPVMDGRKRMTAIPELLVSVLVALKSRTKFAGPNDFILTSRKGTPVSQGNVAKRRLKSIGRAVGMPWLSWQVFHRTHVTLSAEFGRNFHAAFRRDLPYAIRNTIAPI
jgi:integrase